MLQYSPFSLEKKTCKVFFMKVILSEKYLILLLHHHHHVPEGLGVFPVP